jgi:tetraacyldisaccharide 4'-kinase
MEVIELQPFPDHHVYSEPEIAELKRKATSLGATHLVTTEKDWVKLSESHKQNRYIRYVPVETVFLYNGEAMLEKELGELF